MSYKILAFVEVDPRHIDDVKRTIWDSGVCYIGFSVPEFLMEFGSPAKVWEYHGQHCEIEGGHCVILVGYNEEGFIVISWGEKYIMTYDFFKKFVDEAYCIASSDWVNSTGKTPLGMTVLELEELMKVLRD